MIFTLEDIQQTFSFLNSDKDQHTQMKVDEQDMTIFLNVIIFPNVSEHGSLMIEIFDLEIKRTISTYNC